MSLSTITLNSVDYVAFASVAEADAVLAVDPVRGTTWATKTTDEKGALLVAATRRLNLIAWAGSKTNGDSSQPDAFPRTGLTYPDGTAVSTSEVPQAVTDATCLLAGSIAIDSGVANAGSSASNQKRVKAGSAEVEFFRPTAGVPVQDETVWGLIKPFTTSFTSTSTAVGAVTFGGKASDSVFDADDQLGFTLGSDGYA